MAKSPAFLFYSDNFLSGTMFFTMEQRGRYITALCAQHLHGHLTLDQLNSITGNDPVINKKFLQDSEGLWFNARLEKEVAKRKLFCDLQSQRIAARWKKKKSPDTPVIPGYCQGNTGVLPEGKGMEKEKEMELEKEKK